MGKGGREAVADKSQRTVAVIDDQAIMRTLLREIVEGAGHHVVEARCLKEGLELIRARVAHAMVTDLSLDEDAAQMAEQYPAEFHSHEGLLLLEAAREQGLPRVLCSGTITGEVEAHPHAEGAMILKKPFNIEPLQAWLAGL